MARKEKLKLKGYNGNGTTTPLAMEVKMWPTATSASGAGTRQDFANKHLGHGPTLNDAAKLWPTAKADGKSGSKRWKTPHGLSGRDRNGKMAGGGGEFAKQATRWPTPTTDQSPNGHGRRGGKAGNGYQSGAGLESIAKNWRTPDGSPNRGGPVSPESRKAGGHSVNLQDQTAFFRQGRKTSKRGKRKPA